MPIQIHEVVQHLRSTALWPDDARMTDGQLLVRFLERQDQAAVTALLRRHGAMVWGVCRRVLASHHDAEDAFQATFLVLLRKAASIRKIESVGSWLYGVAYQTAVKARANLARRRSRERQVMAMPEPHWTETHDWHDLQEVLDHELCRLPEKCRSAIVLCDLEGKTYKEAARQLHCRDGAVAARLVRGRKMLAERLARRGLVVTAAAIAAGLSHHAASASVPAAVFGSTIKLMTLSPTGQAAAGVVSTKVAALADGVLKAMFLNKIMKLTAVVCIAAGLAVFGTAFAIHNSKHARQLPADQSRESSAPALLANFQPHKDLRPGDRSSDEKTGAAPLHLCFTDGTCLNIAVGDDTLTFVTEYGKLHIPVARLQKLELGRRVPDDVARKITAAIGKLGSDDFGERERAAADLLKFGARAYPELRAASQSDDAEVKQRATEILDKVLAGLDADAPELRRYDIVWTGGSKIIGRTEGDDLPVHTVLGDVKVKVADVRSIGTEARLDSDAKPTDAVADPGNLSNLGRIGTTLIVSVTGQNNGAVWGSDVYTLDSSVAAAAVHAGLLKVGETGRIQVKIIESPPNFTGSTRNGVTTSDWQAFPQGAFKFIGTARTTVHVPKAGNLTVLLIDGSILEVTPREGKVTIITDEGKIAVRIADIQSVELAARVSDDQAAKIAAAVKNLESDNAKDRELAAAELLAQGIRAYPALVTAAIGTDAKIAAAAQSLIARLKEVLPSEFFESRDADVIATKDARLKGKLEMSALQVTSPFLGDLDLRLSDIHSLWSSSFNAPVTPPY